MTNILKELIEPGRKEVPWELTACILTIARFCDQKSELEVVKRWYADSTQGSRIKNLRKKRFLSVHCKSYAGRKACAERWSRKWASI